MQPSSFLLFFHSSIHLLAIFPSIHPSAHPSNLHLFINLSSILFSSCLLPIHQSSIFLSSLHLSIHPSSKHLPVQHPSTSLPSLHLLFSNQLCFHLSVYHTSTRYLLMYPDYSLCSRQRGNKWVREEWGGRGREKDEKRRGEIKQAQITLATQRLSEDPVQCNWIRKISKLAQYWQGYNCWDL